MPTTVKPTIITTTTTSATIVSPVNKPKFSPCALWNSSGITIANTTTNGSSPFSTFVDINNTLYVADHTKKTILVWPEKGGSTNTIVSNLTFSDGLFVSITGDIYVDNGNSSHVSRWLSNTTTYSKIIMHINKGCNSLFIIMDNILYCSINNGHQVIKMDIDNVTDLTIAAGTGCPGSAADMLDEPFGIYVDINLDLYVADTGNNRIQLFNYGKLDGTTVTIPSFPLNKPTSVILDEDSNLFIVDSGNHRIIRSGGGESQCIIDYSMSSCTLPTQLCNPLAAIFDRYGNIYISNQNKNGIQKYILSTNSCSKFRITNH